MKPGGLILRTKKLETIAGSWDQTKEENTIKKRSFQIPTNFSPPNF